MKKYIIPILLIVLIVMVAVVLLGCGSDASNARAYYLQGNNISQKLLEDAKTWQSTLSSSMDNAPDEAALQAAIDKSKATATSLLKADAKAKAEYEKIKGLKGADNYVKYAGLEIAILNNTREVITKTTSFIDQIVSLANSGADTTSTIRTYTDEINKLGDETKRMVDEANQLAAEKNL